MYIPKVGDVIAPSFSKKILLADCRAHHCCCMLTELTVMAESTGLTYSTFLATSFLFSTDSSMYPSSVIDDFQPPRRFKLIRSLPALANKIADDFLNQYPAFAVVQLILAFLKRY